MGRNVRVGGRVLVRQSWAAARPVGTYGALLCISARYLYLTRHAEPGEGHLTAAGVGQAKLLGRRLRDVHFDSILHGPMPRPAETRLRRP